MESIQGRRVTFSAFVEYIPQHQVDPPDEEEGDQEVEGVFESFAEFGLEPPSAPPPSPVSGVAELPWDKVLSACDQSTGRKIKGEVDMSPPPQKKCRPSEEDEGNSSGRESLTNNA